MDVDIDQVFVLLLIAERRNNEACDTGAVLMEADPECAFERHRIPLDERGDQIVDNRHEMTSSSGMAGEYVRAGGAALTQQANAMESTFGSPGHQLFSSSDEHA